MSSSIVQLRQLIKEIILLEFGEATGASGSDPTDVKGFYPYEIERGVDVQGYWYRSPGRGPGSDGDPGRPSNAEDYIGMKAETESAMETSGGGTGDKLHGRASS